MNNDTIDQIKDKIYVVLDKLEDNNYSQSEIVEALRQIYQTYKYDLEQMDSIDNE